MHPLRFLVVGILFTLPVFAFAQTSTYDDAINKLLQDQTQLLSQTSEIQKSVVGSYLDVKINPPTPGPNVPVSITIESYLTDLYKARISWSLNGKVLSSGVGKTTFSFQNGPSGQTTYITLSFTSNTGEVVTKNFSFTPAGVIMMWEADTYTPPFYKGKALLSPQAGVRIVAIPDTIGQGNPVGAGDLVYTWKKDDYTDSAASGYGKNSYSFIGPKPLSVTKITLDVSSLDDSARSEMQVYLPLDRPLILFYEKDPLLGVLYNKPFDTETTLNKQELSLSAEPYYFSNESREGATASTLRYSWLVNGKEVQNYGRTITLRNTTGANGSSLVSLTMRGITQSFQSAKKELLVNFKETSSAPRPFQFF